MAWNGSNGNGGQGTPAQKAQRVKPSSIRGLIAGLLVVVLAAVAAYFVLFSEEYKPQQEKPTKNPTAIKEVAPAITNRAPREVAMITNEAAKTKRELTPEEQKKLRPGDDGFNPSAHPFVLVPKRKKERPPLPYRNATEQALAWIANCEPGDSPLPLLPIPDEEMKNLVAILLDKNEVQEGDTEQTKEQRRIIDLAKAEMRQYIKNGGDPMSFMAYYHKQLEQQHMEYQEAQSTVMEMLRNSDNDDIANDFVRKVNERLVSRGIKPVVLSKKKMERHGIEPGAISVTEQPSSGGDNQ